MTIMGPTTVRSCPHCDQLIREDSYISGNTCDDQHWTDGYMEALMLPNLPDIVKCPTCYAVFWINKAKELGDYNPAIMDSVVNDPKWFKENNPEYWEKLQKDKKKLEHEIYLYKNSLNSEGLNEGDYLAFPDNNKLTNEQERHILTMAWWKANDSNRGTLDSIAIGWYILGDNELAGIFNNPSPDKELQEVLDSYKPIFNIQFSPEQLENIEKLKHLLNEDSDPKQQILKAEIARELGNFEETYRLLNSLFPEEYKERIMHELHEQYQNEKELYEDNKEMYQAQNVQEIYEARIEEEYGDTIKAIKLLCDYKIVCVADTGSVLREINAGA